MQELEEIFCCNSFGTYGRMVMTSTMLVRLATMRCKFENQQLHYYCCINMHTVCMYSIAAIYVVLSGLWLLLGRLILVSARGRGTS